MTAIAPELEVAGPSAGDDDLDHYYCCDEDLGLCGTDLTGSRFADFDDFAPQVCVVCSELRFCPRCGVDLG